jgi:8-oxo-dGTP pyrophosphatase MutT (NUDIX family)
MLATHDVQEIAIQETLFQAPNIDMFRPLENESQYRPTVGLAITCFNRLLIVQTIKGENWILPQGGIKRTESPLTAAIREGNEEVGLKEMYFSFANGHARSILGQCMHHVPEERRVTGNCKKITFFSIPVKNPYWVTLGEENKDYAWVDSPDTLIEKIGQKANEHRKKFQITCDVVRILCQKGLLTWSCAPLELVH